MRTDIWGWVQVSGRRQLQLVHPDVPCLIQPISHFDALPQYAREATLVAFLPRWLTGLQPEQELRWSRRVMPAGTVVQVRATVAGVRDFRFGLRHVEAWLKEEQ